MILISYNYLSECFLLDYRLLFLRFLLLILSRCIFAGKNYCCSNPKIPCPANKYLLKVSGRNPKTWTTCSMSKTLFKCFLVYYEHVFVYCDVFVVTISFSMYLLSILNRFHTLSTFICYQFCIESMSPEEATRGVFLKKVFSKITQYFQENTCVRVSF